MGAQRKYSLDLEGFRALDKERRALITANEAPQSAGNKASDEIARLRRKSRTPALFLRK